MGKNAQSILLLFAGGTALIDRDGNTREVQKARDVRPWCAQIPELDLLAHTQTEFLFAGDALSLQPQWWQSIAKTIAESYADVDGFVVTQPVDAIPYTAAALSLMLQNLGKPVIITGAMEPSAKTGAARATLNNKPVAPELGIRANLVNAVQVATLDLGEVAVLYGNRLLRAGTMVRRAIPFLNVFDSVGVPPLGHVDFGLKLAHHRRRRRAGKLKLALKLKPGIVQLSIVPSTIPPNLVTLGEETIDGVLLRGQVTPISSVVAALIAEARRRRLPVALVAPRRLRQPPGCLVITRLTSTMALIKFMWALGQSGDARSLQALLDSDIVGERLPETVPTEP